MYKVFDKNITCCYNNAFVFPHTVYNIYFPLLFKGMIIRVIDRYATLAPPPPPFRVTYVPDES
jgi:hypothetical protein